MSNKINLVQGNTKPQIVLVITTSNDAAPISLIGANVVLKFKEIISSSIKAIIPCYLAPGKVLSNGTISYDGDYIIAGAGGRCYLNWPEGSLDTPGEFEGEVEITFPDGSIQTVFDKLRFKVRDTF